MSQKTYTTNLLTVIVLAIKNYRDLILLTTVFF